MTTPAQWVAGARPRTLPAAVVPVAVGSAIAYFNGFSVGGFAAGIRIFLALLVALALQVGVNYSNDYSDGIRGTDEVRVGPIRLVGQGLADPSAVKKAALLSFLVACVCGAILVLLTQAWWLLIVGVLAVAAAWFYTGGKRPYGYAGFGELFVFVFFGLVATVGTTYVQADSVPQEAWWGGTVTGLLACAVLLANNLRDIDQDRLAGKKTLTVRIGKRATQVLYTVLVLVAFGIVAFLAQVYPLAWLGLLALIPAACAILIVWTYRAPRELVVALGLTSLTSLAVAGFLCWAFAG